MERDEHGYKSSKINYTDVTKERPGEAQHADVIRAEDCLKAARRNTFW